MLVFISDLLPTGADARGTVYFSAPLYRRNLHYAVVTKHHEGNRVSQAMTDYVLEKHLNDSGIVYCLSKKVADLCTLCMEANVHLTGRRKRSK